MIGVSRDRERAVRDSHEAEVFKKCLACQTRPASIRCFDCLRDHRAELMCYGCSRRVHAEKPQHAYEYATFKDMLLPEDERSLQDSDCLPANSFFRLETKEKASRPYYETTIDPTTNDNSLIAGAEVFTQATDSPAKKQYQTFGRRSDRGLPHKQPESSPNRQGRTDAEFDKENMKVANRRLGARGGDHTGMDGRREVLKSRGSQEKTRELNGAEQARLKASAEKDKYLKPTREPAYEKSYDIKRVAAPPRVERTILREVTNHPVEHYKSPVDSSGNSKLQRERSSRMLNSQSSADRSEKKCDTRHESPPRGKDVLKVSVDPVSRPTPTKTPTKPAKEQRLLSGSNWKARGRGQEVPAQALHSPAYLYSVTELHRTELESLKTRHRVELDRLESELASRSKNFDAEVKSLREELRETSADASELQANVGLLSQERRTREGGSEPEDAERTPQRRKPTASGKQLRELLERTWTRGGAEAVAKELRG